MVKFDFSMKNTGNIIKWQKKKKKKDTNLNKRGKKQPNYKHLLKTEVTVVSFPLLSALAKVWHPLTGTSQIAHQRNFQMPSTHRTTNRSHSFTIIYLFLPAEPRRKLISTWWWYKKWPIASKRICWQSTPCWLRSLLRGANRRQRTQLCSLRRSADDKNTRTAPESPASDHTYRKEYRS